MSLLSYYRVGVGEPLVLLHALGLNRHSWDPILPELARQFDVVSIDLPGFGDSSSLPPQREPTPAALAGAVGELLDELRMERPHVAGNSLGGWVALELANLRPVASLTLLAPAGLWRDRTPQYCRVSLRATRFLARHAARSLSLLVMSRFGRYLVFRQSHGRPSRLTADRARAAITAIGTSPGFRSVLRATLDRRYFRTTTIDAPVTLAFGTKDAVLLPWQSRHVDQLPPQATVTSLPGCGHIPMSDDPAAVAALIRATCSAQRRATL